MLEPLGLDELTEKVYRLLLTKRDLDVPQMAAELDVTVEEVRKAFDQLAELALLRPSWESPGNFRPVSPETGLQVLLQRRQCELVRQQQEIAEAQAAIATLVSEYTTHRPWGGCSNTDSLLGMDQVQARIEELAANARTEVASFMSRAAHDPRALEAAKPLDIQVLGRGVAMRTLCLESVRNDPVTLAYAQWLAQSGASVRTTPTLPLRMLVYDRKIALLPLDPADSRRGVIQVIDTGIVTAVLALFEQIWSSATPVGTVPARDERGLSAQERELLKLLAEGLTDEVAGRQLGLSQRTVRRMMAGIMERLGARSRFEAGLRVAERGWL